MANVVYDYCKSSCDCYKCLDKSYPSEEGGRPSNMSVRNCKVPSVFECYDKVPFRADIIPKTENGYEILNPQIYKNNYDPDFTAIECPNAVGGCDKIQYTSSDPRLISIPHSGQVLNLDRPPLTGDVELDKVADDKNLTNYGQNYKGYSDVNAGDIVYYINKQQQDHFFLPNFSTPAYATGTLYKDPMGSMKPQYKRFPMKSSNPLTHKRDHYEGCLSWMQDSLEHRQDIMSLQMRKQLEQKYEPRWYGYEKNK